MKTELIPFEQKFKPLLEEYESTKYLKRYLNKGGYNILSLLQIYHSDLRLLSVDNIIVGYIVIRSKFPLLHRKERWIYGVRIFPEYRGEGYGKDLMIRAMEICGNNTIFLRVAKDNNVALNLYNGLGFVKEKEEKNRILMKYEQI